MARMMLLLVCHSEDGRFADGDRAAIRAALANSKCISRVTDVGAGWIEVVCVDGGRLTLRAPGLNGCCAFHRMYLFLETETWTAAMLRLVYSLMRAGGFGLVCDLDAPQFLVTQPRQVTYFPWLPEPPRLVRSSRDLGASLDAAV
ncbi:MAG: hypothetical protein M5U29_13655 [Anaerolineae bacterium]|nr:hypothetical protein [Anaerolineae bacterium]